MLIGHFKRRLEGGTLFNRDRGRWPERQRLDRPDRFPSRKDASIATIPTQAKPLSNGEHVEAYKAQPNFAPTAKLRLVSDENPWGYGTPGHAFYTNVIAKNPATVQEALNLAKAAGIKDTQGHLKWLYTWDGGYLEVDGKSWDAKKE